MRRRGAPILLATGLAAVAFHWVRTWAFPTPPPDERPHLATVFPEAYGFLDKGGSPPRWTPYTLGPGGSRIPVGAVVSSSDLAPGIRGYAGPVPVLVGLASDGTITGIALLGHNETPAYVASLESGPFLGQFTGRSVAEPLVVGSDIDGVTRATVTAEAVAAGVRRSARAAAAGIFGLAIPAEPPAAPLDMPRLGTPEQRMSLPIDPLVRRALEVAEAGAVPLLLFLASLSLVAGGATLRWISLAGGLLVIGWWLGAYLSAVHFANALLWRWPAFGREQLPWYLLFAASVVAAVAWRNLWCARLCPFGALQELVHLIARGRLPATAGEERAARSLRLVLLWLAALAVFVLGRAEAAHYEPFATAFDFRGGWLRWVLLGAVLAAAAARHRFWCRYCCPTGTCLQLLGRMRTLNPFDERAATKPAEETGTDLFSAIRGK